MSNKSTVDLAKDKFAPAFLCPASPNHRRYESLRACFVEKIPSAAARFGYTTGSFRGLCHEFRQNPTREFFLPVRKAQRATPGVTPLASW
jgi:hypothetical protein